MTATWSDLLNPAFLARTHPDWAGGASTREEAARLFLDHGVPRLAALDEGLEFDPAYFRETHPAWEGVGDADCYRAFLVDHGAADPPSPGRHLERLGLGLDGYPAAFPWRSYARGRPRAGAHRWAALDDFVAEGFEADGGGLPYGEAAGPFLAALARSYAGRRDDLAIRAFELAAARGTPPAADQHELGDCYLRQEMWGPARRLYGELLRRGDGTLWTVRNLVLAASALGDWDGAAEALASSRRAHGGEALWRDTRAELVAARFEADLASAGAHYADGARPRGDATAAAAVRAAVDGMADGRRRARPRGRGRRRVVLFANLDDPDLGRYRVEGKVRLLERLGRPCTVVPMHQPDAFEAALPEAAAAIFFGVPAVPDQLRALLAATRARVATIYEAADAIFDPGCAPAPLDSYRGLLSPRFHDGLAVGVPLYRAFAGLCDYGLAPTRAVADRLRPIVRRGRAFVLEDGLPPSDGPPEAGTATMVLRSPRFLFLGPEPGTVGATLLAALGANDQVGLVTAGFVHFTAAFNPFDSRIVELGADDGPGTARALASSRVNVAPRFGPGDDGVVARSWLEAAAAGVPTLLSAADAAGLGLRPGEDVLAGADEAACLARALADPAGAAEVGARAKRRLETTRNETVLAGVLGGILESVIARW